MFHCFSSIYFVSSWSFCYCFDDFSIFSLRFTRARRENSHTILCFSARVFLDAEQDDLRFQQRWLVAKARKIRQLFLLLPPKATLRRARVRDDIFILKKLNGKKFPCWRQILDWRDSFGGEQHRIIQIIFCAHRSRVLWPRRRWSSVRENRVFLILKDFSQRELSFPRVKIKNPHTATKTSVQMREGKFSKFVMIFYFPTNNHFRERNVLWREPRELWNENENDLNFFSSFVFVSLLMRFVYASDSDFLRRFSETHGSEESGKWFWIFIIFDLSALWPKCWACWHTPFGELCEIPIIRFVRVNKGRIIIDSSDRI